jgi:hypothetical protein
MTQVREAWDELGIILGGADESRELPLIRRRRNSFQSFDVRLQRPDTIG